MSFFIAATILTVFAIPLFFSVKSTFRVLWVLFGIAALGTLVMGAAYLTAPPSAFLINFNHLSHMNYAQIISATGLPKGFQLGMTLTGSIFTILTFIGFNFSAYYAGEVRQVNRSQIFAMIGSVLVQALFVALVYSSVYYSAGPDFLNAISSYSTNANYTLASPPVLNFLVTFATPNPFVVVLSSLALIATGMSGVVILSFVCVRNMFAWSFDRIMPSWLAKVDRNRGSPYVAVLVTWLLALIFMALYIYTVFFQFLLYAAINSFVTFALASVAAIWFPFRRKAIFNASPGIVKRKIGRLPLIAVLGVAGLIVSVFLTYATIQPAVTAPPTGPILVQALAYAFVPVTAIIAVIIYVVAYYYRRSRGIDMTLAFREIPPE
jgi:amino acid transporter